MGTKVWHWIAVVAVVSVCLYAANKNWFGYGSLVGQ